MFGYPRPCTIHWEGKDIPVVWIGTDPELFYLETDQGIIPYEGPKWWLKEKS